MGAVMIYEILDAEGLVINRIVASEEHMQANYSVDQYRAVPDTPSVPAVPSRITMRQARLALHSQGLYAAVGAAIQALPDPPKTEAIIEWEYSNEVQRKNGFVSSIAPALGLTESQIDDLFILGASL
jgi:hypothetical protein